MGVLIDPPQTPRKRQITIFSCRFPYEITSNVLIPEIQLLILGINWVSGIKTFTEYHSENNNKNNKTLQGYPLWSDLRLLENQVGERFLTHESDDKRWKEYEENNGFVPVYV